MAPLHRPDYSTRLRASDPSDPRRSDTRPAGTVFVMAVATLCLAALMNADVLLEQSESAEYGPGRSVALAVWGPVDAVGSRLGLTRPRDAMDALRNLDTTGDPATKLIVVAGGPQEAGNTGTLGHSDVDQPDPSATPRVTEAEPSAATAGGAPASEDGATPTTQSPDPAPPAGPVTEQGTSTTDPGDDSSPGRPGPSLPGADRPQAPAPSPAPGPDEPEGPTRPEASATDAPLRRPSPEDPLRLLVIGDSTLDPVGAALLRDLATTGVAVGVVDYRVSTGLSRPDFFDWPTHLRELRPRLAPEIVVIMMGANDAQAFAIDDRVVEFGSEEWITTYSNRVEALVVELTSEGNWVVWVGQPVMRSGDFDTKMQLVNSIYAEVAARQPRAVFVDSRQLTVDESGAYAAYLTDADGDRFQMRMTDGVHLTPAGGDRLSPVIVAAIDAIAPLSG